MRRKDREIRDRAEILEVVRRCDVCRLALHDREYPYILPLNFGMEVQAGVIVLYFHGAMEGTKYTLMEQDPRAGFEMDCAHRLVTEEKNGICSCTMEYESVVGTGRLEPAEGEEKLHGLQVLMGQYHERDLLFSKEVMEHTRVFKLVVNQITGKRRKKRQG